MQLSTFLIPDIDQATTNNRLVLDQNKTKWMLFGTRQKLEHCSDHRVQLHRKEIEGVSSFCYRVQLDENLSRNGLETNMVWGGL